MAFNSLDAQREACEAYVVSQRQEGWTLVPDYYDDGGFSGGTLERPALKRLIEDIEAGKVDVVVVYKIDRLSRSLMDFARLVDVFDRNSVTFVSVTQSFNTTTSMGRLTLNVLLSFAQFEREVIGERIRDKVAASRRKGMWMGGWAPLGYRVEERRLVIDEAEAAIVRGIFERFAKGTTVSDIVRDLTAHNFRNRYGQRLDKGRIYKLLNNRVYVGEAVHKGVAYPGEQEGILAQPLWKRVQAILAEAPRTRAGRSRAQSPALLRGLIFDADGRAMSPSHTRRGQRLYRYYVSQAAIRGVEREGRATLVDTTGAKVLRVPAGEVEAAVIAQLRKLLSSPEIIVATWRAARKDLPALTESEVRDAIHRFDPLWEELFRAEQARIVHLLVERVTVAVAGLDIRLKVDGLSAFAGELTSETAKEAVA